MNPFGPLWTTSCYLEVSSSSCIRFHGEFEPCLQPEAFLTTFSAVSILGALPFIVVPSQTIVGTSFGNEYKHRTLRGSNDSPKEKDIFIRLPHEAESLRRDVKGIGVRFGNLACDGFRGATQPFASPQILHRCLPHNNGHSQTLMISSYL
jgi:hypothetical protein